MTSKQYRYSLILFIIGVVLVSVVNPGICRAAGFDRQWEFTIGETDPADAWDSDTLDLKSALQNVARSNGLIRSWDEMSKNAQSLIAQAGRRPNPEIGFEVEEFGGSLPGWSESEWVLSVSQEIELWGKREARRTSATVAAQAVDFEADVARFDIFAEAKSRYFAVALAQSRFDVVKIELRAASEMVTAVGNRVSKGAAMKTNLQLAELDLDRAKVSLREADANWVISRKSLLSLWTDKGDDYEPFYVKLIDPTHSLPTLPSLLELVDGERELSHLALEIKHIEAESQEANSEAIPNLTLSAGIKRLYSNKINSFMVGVSWPLPIFDRRRSQRQALTHQRLSTELRRSQLKTELTAEVKALYAEILLHQARLETISKEIIPKAQATYQTMGEAFGNGRIPYTTMLEGKRILIDLETERNETTFEFWQKLIELEKILGIRLEHHSTR